MLQIRIDTTQIEPLLGRFQNLLSSENLQSLRSGLGESTLKILQSVWPTPPNPSRQPLPIKYPRVGADGRTFLSKFKSIRQQNYVFALIHEGAIPHTRQGDIRARFEYSIQLDRGQISIDISYQDSDLRFVIDRRSQSQYHQGHWWTLQSVWELSQSFVFQGVSEAFFKDTRRLLRG